MTEMKEQKITNIAGPVIYIVIGLLLIIFPTLIGDTICYILGGAALAMGAISLIGYFAVPKEDRQILKPRGLVNGIIPVIIGLFIIIRSDIIISIIPFVIGIMIVLSGVNAAQRALNLKNIGVVNYKGDLIGALVMILFGIVVAVNPFTSAKIMSVMFGAGLVLSGLGSFVMQLRVKHYMKDFDEFE